MTDVKTAAAVEPTRGGKDGINVQAKGGIMDDVEGIITAEHLIVPASFFRFVVCRKKSLDPHGRTARFWCCNGPMHRVCACMGSCTVHHAAIMTCWSCCSPGLRVNVGAAWHTPRAHTAASAQRCMILS